MDIEIDWVLVARYVSGECSIAEARKVEEDPIMKEMAGIYSSYLAENFRRPLNDREWEINAAKALKKVHDRLSISKSPAVSEGWATSRREKIIGTHEKRSPFQLPAWISKIRAGTFIETSAILAAILGVLFIARDYRKFIGTKNPSSQFAYVITTGRGDNKQILLSDGSKVTLNSVSELDISKSFGKHSRVVRLKGEAFFKIKHDRTPFIVQTENGTVEDLGTDFDVKAWPGEGETQVTVSKGKVILRAGDSPGSGGVVVVAGEKSLADKLTILVKPTAADIRTDLAWLKGGMVFDSSPFHHVLSVLNREYPYKFVISDSSLLKRRLTASFSRQPLNVILNAIGVSLGVQYHRTDETVIFGEKHASTLRNKTKRVRDGS